MSETTTTNKINPLVAIAAVSVILFSAVGVGVMTGIIPSSKSEQAPAAPAPQAAATPAPAPEPAAKTEAAPAETPKKVVKKAPRPAPVQMASTEQPRYVQAEPTPPPPAPRICGNCGSVVSVNAVKQQGEGSGLGAVGGAVVGGLLGNQIGRGNGRTAATVVGAVGGGFAGNEVEKHVKTSQSYNVAVRMDNGSSRNFSYKEEPAFRAGDKVKVVEGGLVSQ
jgi:outer membrane lipoprotein SlyB